MCINIPENVDKCINKLNALGYEAYVVGGCVRDSVIGRVPNDWDVCTSALPEDIKGAFRGLKTIDVGIEHGTVAVIVDGGTVEITTYRVDGEYVDNRRPDNVTFTSSLKEDLARRDFTINAMAYSDEVGIVDYFYGQKDIDGKIIRCVGIPKDRFNEDALRIMRALRFAAQLNYTIEEETFKGIVETKELLKNISVERIAIELNKLILADEPQQMANMLFKLDIPTIIINFMHKCSLKVDKVDELTENCGQIMGRCQKDLIIRLTVFLNYIIQGYNLVDNFIEGRNQRKSKMAEEILRSLKYDNYTIKSVSTLMLYYDEKIEAEKLYIKNILKVIDIEMFTKVLYMKKGCCGYESVKEHFEILEAIVENKECYKLKDLKIDGNELIRLGISSGKIVGEMLKALLDIVMINPEMNTFEKLREAALRFMESEKL